MIGVQFADFVEKGGAAVGLLEQSGLVGDRPGERTLDMAEEFAFQQTFGNGAAGDGDKGIGRDPGTVVDGLGHQLLAGS